MLTRKKIYIYQLVVKNTLFAQPEIGLFVIPTLLPCLALVYITP